MGSIPRKKLTARVAAVRIIRELRDAGHVAYLAGGCVRDALLGLEPKDYDIATDALPTTVRQVLPRSQYVGEAFGVVLVYMGGQAIEVATFRSESGYSDRRRPDEVTFTDAEHDAQRRDFTINGLFADPLTPDPDTAGDRIIDYVGGQADLKAGIVRAIGDPSERFGEDYLRMLRAVRFAARLNFQIEQRTAAAILPLAKYLGQISRERIGQEIQAMLLGPQPARAAALIQQLKLDGPALNNDHVQAPVPTLTKLAEQATYPTRLAAWMIDRHLPEPAVQTLTNFAQRRAGRVLQQWRKGLCLSNTDRDALRQIMNLLPRTLQWPVLAVAQRKRLLAETLWPQTLWLMRALPLVALTTQIEREAAPLEAQGVAPTPLVTGDDLIGLGLEPGPRFRVLLDAVYDEQLEGRLVSRNDALEWVKSHVAAQG